ncbi:ABC transporter substrate-binding protein [Natronococcus wangiae]|uniref:ABC transporter substrate-binding protein n=1 Tax=Natronococcus wangiae TaxID=3068275 RepID=UPI00273DD4F0|nr:ABC transporter substrate-binding protein [Natronococcus sp. AD5]
MIDPNNPSGRDRSPASDRSRESRAGVSARRRAVLSSLGAAGAASLAGCGGLLEDGDIGAEDDGASDDALRISIILDPGAPLNSYIAMNARWDWLNDLVFDRLFLPSPQVDEPVPALATESERVDETTWLATVRDGVEWHDGEPFTVDDVVFSYRFYRDGPHSRHAHHVGQVPEIPTIEAEDDETVRFETAYPVPTLEQLTFADLPIMAEHVWSEVEEPLEYQGMPVGTGPYELVEYEEGERLRFEATDEYYLGETTVDEIVVPIIPDPSATFTALKTGELDSTVRSIPPETLREFEGNDEIEVARATQLQGVELRLNFSQLPFRDHDFRWALSRALDIDAIVDVVMLGEAISGTEGFPHPRSPWTAPDLEIPYRPEEAREAFDDLGYEERDDGIRESPEGEPLSFELTVASNEPQYIRAAQLIAAQLDDFGFDLEVVTTDPGTVRGFFGDLDAFDMYISFTNLHLSADPDQFLMNHRGGPNLLWNVDPDQGLLGDHDVDPEDLEYPTYEELEEEYFDAETIDEQVDALHEMHRLHNEQPVAIPLWYPLSLQAYRPDSHDAWAESPGFGITHKYSFLESDARDAAVTRTFD